MAVSCSGLEQHVDEMHGLPLVCVVSRQNSRAIDHVVATSWSLRVHAKMTARLDGSKASGRESSSILPIRGFLPRCSTAKLLSLRSAMSSPAESTKEADVKVRADGGLTPDGVSTERGFFKRADARAFDNDSLDAHYAPIVNHEGAHRYDPGFQWTPQEEKRVVRRACRSDQHCPRTRPELTSLV